VLLRCRPTGWLPLALAPHLSVILNQSLTGVILKRHSFIRKCNRAIESAPLALITKFYPLLLEALMHRTNSRQIAGRHRPSRWAAIEMNAYSRREGANRSRSVTDDAALLFGRFRVLLRQRQLLADGVPVELGTRAFDLLLVLLEADGSLVSKEELLSRVWPGIVVSEENLKVQVSALRKALGADRDVIRTEFGRGYRFTEQLLRSSAVVEAHQRPTRPKLRLGGTLFPQHCRQSLRWGLISD
jgi:DNA-binding winged helix-turn-helix (wHTH) protein